MIIESINFRFDNQAELDKAIWALDQVAVIDPNNINAGSYKIDGKQYCYMRIDELLTIGELKGLTQILDDII